VLQSRSLDRLILLVLVLASLAVAHEMIYLAAHGSGEAYRVAMAEAGHDGYWSNFIIAVGVVSALLLAVGLAQLRRLARLSAEAGAGTVRVRDESLGHLARLVVPVWGRVAVLTTVVFLVQENVETAVIGQPVPGLDALAGQHAMALPLIVAVSFIVALTRALVRWRRDVLLARLRRAAPPRPSAQRQVRPVASRIIQSADGIRRNGVRAPPTIRVVPA
jgi:hypothetical protein